MPRREDLRKIRCSRAVIIMSNLKCGHPISLLIRSVESDYAFCELCEERSMRKDSEEMEYHLLAKLAEEA